MSAVLRDIDEELSATGYVGLHGFSWALRGMEPEMPEPQVIALAREAYAAFRSQTATALVWLTWPPDVERAVPASDDTDLEFDLDTERSVSMPFLALIPAR